MTALSRLRLAALLAVLLPCQGFAFELQGHRGTRGLMPENTLPAFAKALEIGVDVLELDTGITRDGVVVISHDSCLNANLARDARGEWQAEETRLKRCIVDLTFDELQGFDVGRIRPGSGYAKTFSSQQAVDGTHVPRLADLFALVKKSGNEHVRFNIETKISPFARAESPGADTFVDTLLKVVADAGMNGRVTIQSFDWRTLKLVQRCAPSIPTVYLSSQQKFFDNINAGSREGSAWTAGINAREHGNSVPRMVKAAGGAAWSPYWGDVDQAKLKEAQALGLKVVVWTVNEPKDIERMLDWRVDGIISDYPDRVREVMSRRGLPLPPSTAPRK